MISGIDTQYFDSSVRAQDDFYRHVNGIWLDTTQIPPDKGRYGSFDQLFERSLDQLRGMVEGLQKPQRAADPEQQQDRRPVCEFHGRGRAGTAGSRTAGPPSLPAWRARAPSGRFLR